MDNVLTPQNITFILGLIAILFSVFNYFRNPQVDLDKRQALDKSEEASKTAVLAKDLEGEKHATERRFAQMGERMDRALTLAENHTHTVDTKVDALRTDFNAQMILFTKEMTRLGTIIEERLSKK